MPIVDCQEMLSKAQSRGYAAGAFNITSLLDIESLMAAAKKKQSPLIIQTTESVAQFLNPRVITAVFTVLAEASSVPAGLHLDHCTDIQFARQCAECGYTSVMFDGSHEKYDDNIKNTFQVVECCHGLGPVYVEGELGAIGGREDQNRGAAARPRLCDPEQALEFVKRTGVDWLDRLDSSGRG
jgi:ketose-bisphosphate aldolase